MPRFSLCVHHALVSITITLVVASAGCVQIDTVNYPPPQAQTSNRSFVQAARLAGVLQSVTPIQVMVVEYYQYQGRYPASLEQLGLNRADMASGQYIDDLELDQNGNILVETSAEVGEGILVNLVHEETMGGLQTVWNCITNLDASALTGVPGCTHTQDVRKPPPAG